MKMCRTCREQRPRSDFATPQAKRCRACVAEIEAARCRNCGGPAGMTSDGLARVYCLEPECVAAKARDNVAEYRREQRERLRQRRTKRCPVCDRRKPLTDEHWTGIHENDNGIKQTSSPYCRPCQLADQRARYETDERRRRAALERARRQKERERARRRVDPEFDAQIREKYRARSRAARAARRLAEPPAVLEDERPREQVVGRLPAAPLADAFYQWAARVRDGTDDTGVEALAELCGVTARSVFAWRTGERQFVQLDVADRVLLTIDRLWWEVWDPAEYPDAARVWEGEEVAA